jgi:hypothetical protein
VTGCRSHGELIGGYVLGALEPGEVEEMAQHLKECERCATEERRLAGLPALLDQAHAEDRIATPSPRLEDAVLDRFVRERARAARPARGWPRIAVPALAAAIVALAVALTLVLPGEGGHAYARAELWSMPGGAQGNATVAEAAGGTSVQLRAEHLPVGRGAVYELWCVRTDGRWISGGTFRARPDGSAAAQLTAAVEPGDYHVVGGQRGAEVMRGKLTY